MKKSFCFLIALAVVASCSEPLQVTANPDKTSATSGTLGSVKASDGVIPLPADSLPARDSLPR